MMRRLICLSTVVLIFINGIAQIPQLSIATNNDSTQIFLHGLEKLKKALSEKHISYEQVMSVDKAKGRQLLITFLGNKTTTPEAVIKTGISRLPQTEEALRIQRVRIQNKPTVMVWGYDDRGAMYALLDIANRISWSKDPGNIFQYVKEVTSEPYIKERGLSLYTMNRAYWESRFYDENYWTEYLDMMAQNRFNMLEILFGYENGGFMAPCYPYFFNVEGFPDVKMEGITAEQQARNLATMKHLIKMAHDRGIAVRLSTWDHIYRGAVQAGGNPAFEYKPGQPQWFQVGGLDSANIRPYTKAAFAKFVKLIPEMDALLFKTNNESGLKDSELYEFSMNFFETVKESAPNLMIDIHGKGLTDTLISGAINLGIKFRIVPKFWMEQLGLPFSPTHVNREDQRNRRHGYGDMLRYPQKYQMVWKLWNGGTNRVFLWADPGYVRRYAESSRFYNSSAYEVYEPLATKMESQAHDMKPFDLLKPEYQYYHYEFERYWNFFQVWGLIGYDPNTPSDIWDKEYEKRFGAKVGPIIKSALNEASWVLPRIVASCYPYSFFPTTSAWPEKQRLGDLNVYAKAEGSDIQQFASFDEEARVLLGELETGKTVPSTTSAWLAALSENINKKIAEAEKLIGTTANKEFNSTITDLKMLSNLALYHSRRVPAAVSYCLFLRTNDVAALDEAIAHEQKAAEAWQQIVNAAGDMYADKILIGKVPLSGHWKDELVMLNKGIEKLKEQRANFKSNGTVRTAPRYRAVADGDNGKYFTVSHQAVNNIPAGQPVTVKIKVSAPAGLKWVHLQYRAVNQYKDFTMLPMTKTGEKDVYQATIPADKIDTKYNLMYLMEMMDNKGKGFIYPDLNKETPYKVVNFIRK